MKKIAIVCISLIFLFSGCNNDETVDAINVQGTWRAAVTFQSCSPVDVCSDTGFTQGSSLNAIMNLSQNSSDESEVDGNYMYEGIGISADVNGDLGGTQLALDGIASNPLGSITVRVAGNVSDNVLTATVVHQINLVDGRTGNVNGTGTFTR